MKFPKMNQKLKAVWIKALKSGAYTQCRHSLISGNNQRHCCLGVLHDLLTGSGELCTSFESSINVGIHRDAHVALVRLNDHEKWNFERIAAWIEKNL